MPRDKTENHEKILAAAYDEFLEYGFNDASMRRIAAACGMSASGLYKHFPSKEEMFSALVEPAYAGLKEQYFEVMDQELDSVDESFIDNLWEDNADTVWIIKYIYKHFNAFKLLVCRSQGTRYEDYVHELAVMEENSTQKYINKMKKFGINLKMIPKKEYHLFVTSNINAIFETVVHDFTEKEALSYARHLDKFSVAGWKKLMLEDD